MIKATLSVFGFLAIVACVFADDVTVEEIEEGKFCNKTRRGWKERSLNCSEETGVKYEDVKQYWRQLRNEETPSEPENFGCFLKCIFVDTKWLSRDGAFKEMPEQLPHKEEVESCLSNLKANLSPSDEKYLCDVALGGHKCFLQMVRNHRSEWKQGNHSHYHHHRRGPRPENDNFLRRRV